MLTLARTLLWPGYPQLELRPWRSGAKQRRHGRSRGCSVALQQRPARSWRRQAGKRGLTLRMTRLAPAAVLLLCPNSRWDRASCCLCACPGSADTQRLRLLWRGLVLAQSLVEVPSQEDMNKALLEKKKAMLLSKYTSKGQQERQAKTRQMMNIVS